MCGLGKFLHGLPRRVSAWRVSNPVLLSTKVHYPSARYLLVTWYAEEGSGVTVSFPLLKAKGKDGKKMVTGGGAGEGRQKRQG